MSVRSAASTYDEIVMISLELWRARIGLFVPKSTCPRRELLVARYKSKRWLDVDVVRLLLTLVISSVTSKPKMLAGDVDTNAELRQNQSKCTNSNFLFYRRPLVIIMVLIPQNCRL